MAALTTARPVSQILSDEFDLFSDPSSSQPSSSRQRRGHYRPFSTLYTESPYVEIDAKPARLKRSSSVGGLHAFQTMTLFKSKKDSPSAASQASQSGTPVRKVSAPLKLKPKQDGTKKSTASSSTRPLSPSSLTRPRLKTKRSMASIFTGSDATATPPISASPESSSPLVSRPILVPPPTPEDPPRPSTAKSVKFKETDLLLVDEPPPQTFVPMNIWAKRHHMKLHPYGSEAVYMQAYDPILLENDRYSDLLLQRLSNGSPSFYDYGKKPPATALDLGCGEGHWVLYSANIWKTSKITGFDLVDITLPAFEMTENAHFVQGNFLKYKLPFEDESFEYVRIANLALCIPYGQWENLLVEIRRVMTRGGRLEVIDDHLTFPYGNAPVPKEKARASPRSSNRSSFDIDDYSDDDVDGETLQGEGSEEDSTLNSDGSRPSSFDEKHFHTSPLSPSDTIRPLARHRSPTPDPYDKPIMTDPYFAQSDDATWRQRSMASRELESLFCSMLTDLEERHWVYPWPSHFVVNFMKYVFGSDNAGKTQSFSIKLAEWDSPIGVGAELDDADKEDLGDAGLCGKKKNWMTIEWEKKEKKHKEKKPKEKKGGLKNGAAGAGRSSSERSSSETPVPPVLKPKAARQLGLPLPPDATLTTNSKTSTKPKKDKSPPPSAGITPSAKTPSAKAAGVFGMSYTELVAATAKATAGRRRGLKPQGLVQSPGLLIGQATYIPLDPLEVEMHACKFVHTLLGCRPALEQYVSKFLDENGKRLVDDDMFAYHMSEYEAFRRLRFGWPSDAAEPLEEDLLTEPSPLSLLDSSPNGLYQLDEPTHIRSIRVFQAIKADNSPHLAFSSHSPPKS